MKTSIYMPYGAFEMKATYQRNLLLGTLAVTVFVALVLLGAALYPETTTMVVIPVEQPRDSTIVDLTNTLTIERSYGGFGTQALPQEVVPYAIPVPAPDEQFIDDESPMIASRSEMARLGLPIGPGDGGLGEGYEGGGVIDTLTDYIPPSDEPVFPDVPPEMIRHYKAEYPRVIRDMGLTGTTTVRVLLDEEGRVMRSELARSSGVEALDEVAVRWGKKCIFSPAIKNHQPIKIWVYFTYEFVLD